LVVLFLGDLQLQLSARLGGHLSIDTVVNAPAAGMVAADEPREAVLPAPDLSARLVFFCLEGSFLRLVNFSQSS
jgi:hypothetical protein